MTFTPYAPWPLTLVPASAWRVIDAAPGDADAIKTLLLKKDEVGVPRKSQDGRELSWVEPKPSADGACVISRRSPEDTLFLVGHLFMPMKYHIQPYKFKLSAPKGVVFHIDGRKLDGMYDDGAGILSCKSVSSDMRQGLNRMVLEIPPAAVGTDVRLRMSNPGDVKVMADIPPSMDPKVHVGDWPSTAITNGIVTATVAVPNLENGFYRGNRFEQAGIVTNLERDGHTYFLDAPSVHAPLNSSECCGPCEEWFEAVAYDDAKPGEPFIKLGVGLYEKPYHPSHLWYCGYWPVKMFPWTTKAEKDRIEFVQEVDGPRGWGYRYVKRLVLVPGKPVLLIEHSLTNTGKHRIDAEQYAHNFMALDRKPVAKGLKVAFSFQPKTAADISKLGVIAGNCLEITADKLETKFIPIEGWKPDAKDISATITTPATPSGIRISGDFHVSKLGVFITPEQISCEPFMKVSVEPGETTSWTRSCEFLIDGAALQ